MTATAHVTATAQLEEAKLAEIAARLREQGYQIQTPFEGYDIVALRGNEKIAYEIKARSDLGRSSSEIERLRRIALAQGYDFRLIVVNEPTPTISIEHLTETLLLALQQQPPVELRQLAESVTVSKVTSVEIRDIEVTRSGIRAAGDGVVEVILQVRQEWDFPFDFDVFLRHDLTLDSVRTLRVNTTGVEPGDISTLED